MQSDEDESKRVTRGTTSACDPSLTAWQRTRVGQSNGSPSHLEGRLWSQRPRVAHCDDREAVNARLRKDRQRVRLDDAGGGVVRQPLHVRRREPVQQAYEHESDVMVEDLDYLAVRERL